MARVFHKTFHTHRDHHLPFDVGDRITKARTGAPALTIDWTKGNDYVPVVIWQDVQGLVKEISYDKSKGYVTVETDKSKGSGNAVVGLYPAGTTTSNYTDKDCLWSWHVWVTDYRPDGTKDYGLGENSYAAVDGGQVHTYGAKFMTAVKAVTPTKNRVIMDRNLGATAALYANASGNNYPTWGLFYQWGRKDPFPKATNANDSKTSQTVWKGDGSSTTGFPVSIETAGNASAACRKPHVFYSGTSSTSYDWQSPQQNAAWGDKAEKSVYDPCPEGWRVAPNGTWSDFGRSNFPFNGSSASINGGRLYTAGSVKAWYPAPGYRYYASGALRYVGDLGYSWSSTVAASGYSAHDLYFDTQSLLPTNTNYRAYGLQVRCLQE